jgi:hypothetical protein
MLLAAKKYGVRPLIILYAPQEHPGPAQAYLPVVTRTARAGDTKIQVADTTGLQAGYSGLDIPDERPAGRDGPYTAAPYPPTLAYAPYDWAAGNMITAVYSSSITLAKPLQASIPAKTLLHVTTLKYRPFSIPGSADYVHTMDGWLNYVQMVADFVTGVLGTATSTDKGFDLEVWNELSQSPHFLFINDYYGRTAYHYDEQSIYHNLVAATAGYIDARPADFAGVQVGDSLATNIPWPASSTEPARVTAIDKHPYERRITYPQPASPLMAFDASVNSLWNKGKLDALFAPDPTSYVPSYTTFFPEYFATDLRTDNIIRDMAPIATRIGSVVHGRNARVVQGKVIPTTVWITEVALSAREDSPTISMSRSLYDEAKTVARYFCFYLGKGATQVDMYAAIDPDKGLLAQNFLALAQKRGAAYPRNDTAYTRPALQVTGRIVHAMSLALDTKLTRTRPVTLLSVTDTHDHWVFKGDGTAAHPTLYDRDVFTFLPFEVNPHRFVIPYYVMTRDILASFHPERFTVRFAGIRGTGADVSAYDPINNVSVPLAVTYRDSSSLSVDLTAADYPYLLTIQEH